MSEFHNAEFTDVSEMDVVGALEGSDKSSSVRFCWDYLRHYQAIFSEFRHKSINLVEVGIERGPSLRVWKWYFSTAHIVGIDIDPKCRSHAADRISIEIGSQADPDFLESVCTRYPPTIFIDDGSHLAEHNISTFENVFPKLLPGGVYVVEDLALHFQANRPVTTRKGGRNAPEYFLALARSCMARHSVRRSETVPESLLGMVDSVSFIRGAAILRKTRDARPLGQIIHAGNRYIETMALGGSGYNQLAHYILKHLGPTADADASCAAAIAKDGRTLEHLVLSANIMLQKGLAAEASALLAEASASSDMDFRLRCELAKLQVKAGLVNDAIATLKMVLANNPKRAAIRRLLNELEGRSASATLVT